MKNNAWALATSAGLTTLGWAGVILLMLCSVVIAMGAPLGPVTVLLVVLAILVAYHYPYFVFGSLVLLTPFLGLTISISTGELAMGVRAFGGSIDVSVVEIIAVALIAAWVIKIVALWLHRHDANWKPWLPLALPMLAVVSTHAFSALSPFNPDTVLVLKYTLRPVAWCYLVYVALTVNHIRSRKRLVMTLGIIAATGLFATLMGAASLAVPGGAGELLPRARPLPLFGYMPLGDNHNLLAEWLAVCIPTTLALALLAKKARTTRLLVLLAAAQAFIALLTFARTVWIVLALQALFMGFVVWRAQLQRWASTALVALVLLIPLGITMFAFSSTALVQSSTSTRLMLSQIALNLWSASPIVGMGAGIFVERVGATQVFLIEYGAPLDSHGVIQKLLAETGLLGLMAFGWLVFAAYQFVRDILQKLPRGSVEERVFLLLASSAGGALVYQLFNTNYWNGKLWLPLGILLAASRVFLPRSDHTSLPDV